jgi:hypothetical protein
VPKGKGRQAALVQPVVAAWVWSTAVAAEEARQLTVGVGQAAELAALPGVVRSSAVTRALLAPARRAVE